MSTYVPLFTTNFQGADQNPLDGPLWQSSGGGTPLTGLQTISNLCYATDVNFVNESHLEIVLTDNQYSEITINAMDSDGSSSIGTGVRHGETFLSGYLAAFSGALNDPNGTIFILSAFAPISAGFVTTVKKGDILRCEAVGTTIKALLNGVVVLTITDATWTSGDAAIDIGIGTLTILDTSVSRFEAGNIVGAGAAYSVPDCRNYGNFPNAAENLNDTYLYDVPFTDSRAGGPPIDSRTAGTPVDCRVSPNIPKNSRTPGTFGPGE